MSLYLNVWFLYIGIGKGILITVNLKEKNLYRRFTFTLNRKQYGGNMYKNIAARVSETIVKDIDYVAEEEHTDKSKVIRELLTEGVKSKLLELALRKYSKREVSIGKAAELAKMPLADFMMEAAEHHIPINYSKEDLIRDFKAAQKAK